MKLRHNFYQQNDVLALSEQLLGKVLCTCIDGVLTSGIICETEAYAGVIDKASHAYGGRRTKRTEVMYAKGGISYVYLCYGIHYLFNVVTSTTDIPEAVLIRGILPVDGLNTIKARRNLKNWNAQACIGPGKVCKALGIDKKHNALDLEGELIWIEDRKIEITPSKVIKSPRVGIDYAEEDALLPYRFQYLDFLNVS